LAVPQISASNKDAELPDAKLVELRREIAHTNSPRFRDTLHEVEGMLQRM
jgi:hypothetical protein